MSKSLKNTQSPEIGGARSASRYAQEIRQTVSNLHDTARRRTLGAGEEPHRRQVTGKTRLPTHGDIGLKEQRDDFNVVVLISIGSTRRSAAAIAAREESIGIIAVKFYTRALYSGDHTDKPIT